MLTGMIEPTSGTVTIDGLSLVDDIDRIRKEIGLCQQFDVLEDYITVKHHLQLVCDLKDVPRSQVSNEIRKTLELVMLTEH